MVLKVASVIGKSFEKEILYAVYPIKEELHSLKDTLHLLIREGLIGRKSKGIYSFKNTFTYQVVYNRLLHTQREDLHRKVIQQYEQQLFAIQDLVGQGFADEYPLSLPVYARLAIQCSKVLEGATKELEPGFIDKALCFIVQAAIMQMQAKRRMNSGRAADHSTATQLLFDKDDAAEDDDEPVKDLRELAQNMLKKYPVTR